jgi:hypothetical protein
MYPLQDPRSLPVESNMGSSTSCFRPKIEGTVDKGRAERPAVRAAASIQTEDPKSCRIKELLLIFGGAWFEPPTRPHRTEFEVSQ